MNNDFNSKSIRNMNWLWRKLNVWKPLLFNRLLWWAFIYFLFFYSLRIFLGIWPGLWWINVKISCSNWNSFIRSSVRPFVHWLWKMNDDEHTSNLISIFFILSNTQFTLLYFYHYYYCYIFVCHSIFYFNDLFLLVF